MRPISGLHRCCVGIMVDSHRIPGTRKRERWRGPKPCGCSGRWGDPCSKCILPSLCSKPNCTETQSHKNMRIFNSGLATNKIRPHSNVFCCIISVPVCTQSLSCVQPFATPWTVAFQAPLSMAFSRQEYWSRLPFPAISWVFQTQGSNTLLLCLLHNRWILYHWATWETP